MKKLIFVAVLFLTIAACKKNPVAVVSSDKDKAFTGETITFTSTSENAEKVSWDFGDGSSADGNETSHSYSAAGTYGVKVAVFSKKDKKADHGFVMVTITAKPVPNDPTTAQWVSIDRFSDAAGNMFKRSMNPGLPAANAPVNFDDPMFASYCLGPNGEKVKYLHFDVQSILPPPIYILKKSNGNMVAGQLNIADVIPGDAEYSDFWRMYEVNVPDDYVANTISSLSDIQKSGYTVTVTDMVVNCPFVPKNSTATERYTGGTGPFDDNGLHQCWYKGKIVGYFNYGETPNGLVKISKGLCTTSPVYVAFNINPDMNNPASGPMSGVKVESGSNPPQSHNVMASLPADADYSPIWAVYVYDNSYFNSATNLAAMTSAPIMMQNAMYVNCPIVDVN